MPQDDPPSESEFESSIGALNSPFHAENPLLPASLWRLHHNLENQM